MNVEYNILSSICFGIALSACCGFRIFIPLLAASIAGFNNWIVLPADTEWMASWPAIICFGSASLIEIGAYYIPFLDNILDTIATPIAVIAGTLLAASLIASPGKEPLVRWGLGLLAGGTTAGIIQVGTGLLRLFSTKATVGTGNIVIASGENFAAVTGAILSFIIPIIMSLLLLLLVIWVIYRSLRRLIRHEEKIF